VMTLQQIVAAERLLTPPQLMQAARLAHEAGEPLIVRLVEGGLSDVALAAAIARHLGVAEAALEAPVEVDTEALRQVPYDLARERRLVPLAVDTPAAGPRILRLAMADPSDSETMADLEAASGMKVEAVVAPLRAVEAALRHVYRGFVTAVIPRAESRRAPFGGDLRPQTQPFRTVEDDAPLELRHRALLELLVARGVITFEEYLAELRRLL
jgi:type II secretion system (T2SS) protein E